MCRRRSGRLLKPLGVRAGRFALFLPALLKPHGGGAAGAAAGAAGWDGDAGIAAGGAGLDRAA